MENNEKLNEMNETINQLIELIALFRENTKSTLAKIEEQTKPKEQSIDFKPLIEKLNKLDTMVSKNNIIDKERLIDTNQILNPLVKQQQNLFESIGKEINKLDAKITLKEQQKEPSLKEKVAPVLVTFFICLIFFLLYLYKAEKRYKVEKQQQAKNIFQYIYNVKTNDKMKALESLDSNYLLILKNNNNAKK